MSLITLQLWVCGNQTVTKFKGDVQAYKVILEQLEFLIFPYPFLIEPHRQQHQS
jgi:hypothetical protein